MLNRTHTEHTLFALLTQVFIGLIAGNWWIGAAFGAAFFIGREHAQAEAKVRKEGWAKRPYFECFAPRYWSLDAVLDFVVPTLAVTATALVMETMK